jgi:hypothetical protein
MRHLERRLFTADLPRENPINRRIASSMTNRPITINVPTIVEEPFNRWSQYHAIVTHNRSPSLETLGREVCGALDYEMTS